ncbi:DUF1456 family protein [Pseudomonas sp. RIT-PI-AD]|uniref:DUF1456 family protein n=1 Tax=Pseudomonas sp. RIT-PI-AD TaxID=3035294 RepID=UPI0021DA3F8C|nr:DUF1456 family protein [Pseudomonas sp. RIT-PI-AD]
MTHNDVLRSLRYLLDVSDAKLGEIAALADHPISEAQMSAYLRQDDQPGFQPCEDETLAHVLDGLIYFKRGRDDSRPPHPMELPVSNNLILKKLRVAFELKDEDMHAILEDAGLPMNKPELNALFRKKGHKNYRECGDQVLRHFLKGLTLRLRG